MFFKLVLIVANDILSNYRIRRQALFYITREEVTVKATVLFYNLLSNFSGNVLTSRPKRLDQI